MLPSLVDFSRETGFDCACHIEGLQAAWSALQAGSVDRWLMQKCASHAPDTEIYSHKLTSYALSAAVAVAEMVEFTADGSEDHIAQIKTLARDSIYIYLDSLDGSEPVSRDFEFETDPLWVKELRRQEDDVKFLSNLSEPFDSGTVSLIRTRAKTQESLLPH